MEPSLLKVSAWPDFSLEQAYTGNVAGLDEAGRGPWAGPVVAAAVILDRCRIPSGIHDSKLLRPEVREDLYEQLSLCAIWSIGVAEVEEIDQLNILGATKLAMQRAVRALVVVPDVVLVDGNQPPSLPCQTVAIVGGDARSVSIAAASIFAKVTRDRMMRTLAQLHPGYGWERNKGYSTAEHLRALLHLGATPQHRRSFAPVRLRLGLSA